VVTKKQRRTQLERARAQRRSERLAHREARRRRIQQVLTVIAVLVAVGALAAWILTRDDGSPATAPSSDYDAVSAFRPTTPIEVLR
jgi:hypothetical protein